MKIVNPKGKKEITVNSDETVEIYLEDLDMESREFTLQINLMGDNSKCLIEGRIHCQNSDKKIWNITQIFRGKNQIGKTNLQGVAESNSILEMNATGLISSESKQSTVNISEKILLFEKAKGKLFA